MRGVSRYRTAYAGIALGAFEAMRVARAADIKLR